MKQKTNRVLVTGGAGFIGSHVVDDLVAYGYQVRILDNLLPQVHGPDRAPPEYLNEKAEFQLGDVTNSHELSTALDGIDAVIHLAAVVGVGQSMYEMAAYVRQNAMGTAILCEHLSRARVKKLVVASSMSVYGEGLYRLPNGQPLAIPPRSLDRLMKREWDPIAPTGEPLAPAPTPEGKPVSLESVYALTKFDQETLALLTGRTYQIPTIALRFFNVFGPRQALSNPYTGVVAIFASRLMSGSSPVIFEDGQQLRDFVYVTDAARACRLAIESSSKEAIINIASGNPITIRGVASQLANAIGVSKEPVISQKYRRGDIRHCIADIRQAKQEIKYVPEMSFSSGIQRMVVWLQDARCDCRFEEAFQELVQRGLAV